MVLAVASPLSIIIIISDRGFFFLSQPSALVSQ